MKKVLLGLLALVMLVAGCSAASHIRQLQPPQVPSSPPIRVPATSMQLGIDVDWYAYVGQNVKTQAAQTVAYVLSLHANALSVSFPFFMDGTRSGSVHATAGTPAPAELSTLIDDAQEAGLTVSLRPLLDEPSLGASRVHWVPADEPAFFAAYKRFTLPYLQLGQRDGVAEFIEATELSAFDTAPGWSSFTRWARKYYSGKIACAANWSSVSSRICGAGVAVTVDAYHKILGSELRGWEHWDAGLPHGTVLTEVGIAAAPQAPGKPYAHSWDITQVDPEVQARWFTAACDAAEQKHLGGIYFWSVGLGTPAYGPTLSDQGAWAGSAGATAISSCFAAVGRGSL